MAELGIDISAHNGDLDLEKLVRDNNIDFVIIRAGFGYNSEDKKFKRNVELCKSLGIPFGFYWYSYALNTEDAKIEANSMLKLIEPYKNSYSYGVWFDMEDADGYKKSHGMPSNQTLRDICKTFCSIVEGAGYYTGIYASKSWFDNQLNDRSLDRYDYWIAQWLTDGNGNERGLDVKPDEKSGRKLWQFTSNARLNGARFDANYSYVDYPSKIRGGDTPTPAPTPKPTPKPDIIYQTFTNGRWLPNVVNTKDYAGLYNKAVTGVYANLSSGNVRYKVHLNGGKWLPEVKNREDYAGIKGKNIDGLMMKSDTGTVKYRVHILGGSWLPWVTGYNEKDSNNGYAGIMGKTIDGIQAQII